MFFPNETDSVILVLSSGISERRADTFVATVLVNDDGIVMILIIHKTQKSLRSWVFELLEVIKNSSI